MTPRWMPLAGAALGLALAMPVQAAGKTCEELVLEIAAKMDAAGVKGYNLEVLPTALVGDAKVVGSCENGSKKVTYDRGAPVARSAAAATRPAARPASAPASAPTPRKP